MRCCRKAVERVMAWLKKTAVLYPICRTCPGERVLVLILDMVEQESALRYISKSLIPKVYQLKS